MEKTILLIIAILSLYGCAHQPVITKDLIEKQVSASCNKSFDIVFKDKRDTRFKNEKWISEFELFGMGESTLDDLSYDEPLNIVFEKMVAKRFLIKKKGIKAEFKLKAFYTSFEINDLVAVPFLGILAVGADVKWNGVLRVDVAILDNQNKFILNKSYDERLVEMRSPHEKAGEGSLEIMHELFANFSTNLEDDIKRTRFPGSYSSTYNKRVSSNQN